MFQRHPQLSETLFIVSEFEVRFGFVWVLCVCMGALYLFANTMLPPMTRCVWGGRTLLGSSEEDKKHISVLFYRQTFTKLW